MSSINCIIHKAPKLTLKERKSPVATSRYKLEYGEYILTKYKNGAALYWMATNQMPRGEVTIKHAFTLQSYQAPIANLCFPFFSEITSEYAIDLAKNYPELKTQVNQKYWQTAKGQPNQIMMFEESEHFPPWEQENYIEQIRAQAEAALFPTDGMNLTRFGQEQDMEAVKSQARAMGRTDALNKIVDHDGIVYYKQGTPKSFKKTQHTKDKPQSPKQNTIMEQLFGNLKFGKLDDKRFKMSMLGIAIRDKNGDYVVYDADEKKITSVGNMVIEGMDFFFAIPTDEPEVGDLILDHSDTPLYITKINEDGSMRCASPTTGNGVTRIKRVNLFDMQIVTKVVSIMDAMGSMGDKSSGLFGNPMMFMAMSGGMGSGSDSNSMMNMMMMSAFMGKGSMFSKLMGKKKAK